MFFKSKLFGFSEGAYRDYVTSFYSALKISKLSDLFKHKIAKIVLRHFRDNLPPLIPHLFTKTCKISSRATRALNDLNTTLYVPRYCTDRLRRCIKNQRVKIWNDILTEIKNKSFNHFKRQYKNYLLKQYSFFFLKSLSCMSPHSMNVILCPFSNSYFCLFWVDGWLEDRNVHWQPFAWCSILPE